ncbi:hypothetical protein LOK49_LG12G02358 [Camellia lanceoleosa]|uniref:Uncharacterized protein n=1 Tax=Camellia lanceoleosa TaxID=1840588 RepID=A0ACC0FTD4_9ERIC|nr:hypothetical protein LOK49_LG12G02358 [Camellia lanceoleosa]
MADNTEEIPATSCSVPGEDPLISATADGGEKPHNNDPDDNDDDSTTTRQPKRKKNCPTSLTNFESIKHSSPNSSFSFTFDTNFAATPEFTPKFGSFNSLVAAPETDRRSQIPATCKRKAEAEEEVEEEEKSEGSEEGREIGTILSSIDGVETSVDRRICDY